MTVYVDNSRTRATINGTTLRWSRLLADTSEELISAARGLNLDPASVQQPGTPSEHFLISDRQRSAVLKLGAERLDLPGVAQLIGRKTYQRAQFPLGRAA